MTVKPILKKLFSATLSAVMLISPLTAYASDALGNDLAADSTTLSTGIMLADGTFWSDSQSDLRQENYIVYTPGSRAVPLVTYGETSRSLTKVSTAAQELEEQGYRVVAGINGDYYGVQHGIPIGTTMSDGALRNISCDPYYAVGFRADGSALIGDPQLTINASVNGGEGFSIYSFNHVRQSDYGIFLYDSRFNDRHTTGTSESGIDVICAVEDGALSIGSILTLRVVAVLGSAVDTEVPEGGYVLSVNRRASEGYTAPLLALQSGDQISVSVTSQSGSAWNEVVNLIGAPELLVENGAVTGGLPTGSAPRTAIGQKADGTLIFYTIDGRKSGYSIGATLTAVAMRLAELGCVTAVALDGGGSTTLVATMPNEMAARVVNRPSDGAERAVSNHVLLVASNKASGNLDHLYLAPSASRAMPGAKLTLTASGIDTNDIPMNANITLRTDKGRIEGETLTLPDETGTVTVTASFGSRTATAEIAVVEPEHILLSRNGSDVSTLSLAPNSDVLLTAEGIANHLPLVGDNSCFTWAYEGTGASILSDGYTLHSGTDAGSGTLTVSVGRASVSIPVTVTSLPLTLLNDFETDFAPLSDRASEPQLTLSRATESEYVKLGNASAMLRYTLDGTNAVSLPVGYAVDSGHSRLDLWVYGDASGAALTVLTDAGLAAPISLDFNGWKPVSLSLPEGARNITGLAMASGTALKGAIWLDQLVLSNGKQDVEAPEVSLTLEDDSVALTGSAFDAVNGTSLPTLRLAYDGAALTHTYDKRTGALSAMLPEYDGRAHNVTLTAGDAAGNLARASVYIPAADTLTPAFPDLEGHWANASADYLMRTGISNGSDWKYKPDDSITRQEFATMLYRYLDPEQDFSGAEMPFYDMDRIAPWAMDAARATYALGIIGGGKDADGHLRFMPESNINRQEAVTMLGRLLGKGFAVHELPYTDAASIPAWAAEYVSVLSSAGVFSEFVTDAFEPTRPLTRGEMASMLLRIN